MRAGNQWRKVFFLLLLLANPCFAARPSDYLVEQLDAGLEVDRRAVDEMAKQYVKIKAEDAALSAKLEARRSSGGAWTEARRSSGGDGKTLASHLKVGERFLLQTQEDGWATVTLRQKDEMLTAEFKDGASLQFRAADSVMAPVQDAGPAASLIGKGTAPIGEGGDPKAFAERLKENDHIWVRTKEDGWAYVKVRQKSPGELTVEFEDGFSLHFRDEDALMKPAEVPARLDLLDDSRFAQAVRKAVDLHSIHGRAKDMQSVEEVAKDMDSQLTEEGKKSATGNGTLSRSPEQNSGGPRKCREGSSTTSGKSLARAPAAASRNRDEFGQAAAAI